MAASRPAEFPATLLAGTCGSLLHLWECPPGGPLGSPRPTVAHASQLAAAAWNRNNKVVATAGADGTIKLCYSNSSIMTSMPREPEGGDAPRRPGPLTSLSWSGGSKRLAAGSADGAAYVYHVQDRVCHELRGHKGEVTAVEFTPDDALLAAASAGGEVALYSYPSLAPAGRLEAPDPSARTCLSAAAGEPLLAAGAASGGVLVWDAAAGRLLEARAGQHAGRVAALAFVPLRAAFLYSAGADGRLCLQDRRAGKQMVIAAGAPLHALSVREDNSLLAAGTAEGTVLVYDARHSSSPLHTLCCAAGQPVTSLHWQHVYPNLQRRAQAAAATGASQPAPAEAEDAGRPAAVPAGSRPAAVAALAAALAAAAPTPVPAAAVPVGAAAKAPAPRDASLPTRPQHAAPPAVVPATLPSRAPLPAPVAAQRVGTAPAPARPAAASIAPAAELHISPLPSAVPQHVPAAAGAGAAATPSHASHVTPIQQRLHALQQGLQRDRPAQLSVTPLSGVGPGAAAAATVGPAPAAAATAAELPPSLDISPLSTGTDAPRGFGSQATAGAATAGAAASAVQHTPAAAAAPPVGLEISPLSSTRPQAAAAAAPRLGVLRETTNSQRPSPRAAPGLLPASPAACSVQRPASSFRSALSQQAPAASTSTGAMSVSAAGPASAMPADAAMREADSGPAAAEASPAPRQPEPPLQHKGKLGLTVALELPPDSGGRGCRWRAAASPGPAAQLPPAAAAEAPQPPPPAHEFSFAAAEQSLGALQAGGERREQQQQPGPQQQTAPQMAVAPEGLREDILALHLDMLNQFQAAQEQTAALVASVVARQDALAAEVGSLRKQLAKMTQRRDQSLLWL